MDKASGVLIADQTVRRLSPAPRLKLLIDWEPRRRVFFGNLADLLLRRQLPPVPITSRPGRFWPDVFIATKVPWNSFLESLLWHLLLLILFVWSQSRVWQPVKTFQERDAFHHSVVYYPPAKTFAASEGRAPEVQKASRLRQKSPHSSQAHQAPMAVTPERKPALVTPPDIKQAAARPPDLPASQAVPPMAPFSAAAGPRRNALAGPAGVVAPPPQVDPGTGHKLALPQASAVAPAPELGGPSAGRAFAVSGTPSARVVPPPPSVQNSSNTRARSVAGSGSQAVPPPVSVDNADDAARAGRTNGLPGTGTSVVPPAPSIPSAGNRLGEGRVNSMAAGGSQVVQPPPSIQTSGSPSRPGRMSSIAGSPSSVVPPAPSVQSAGSDGGARIGTMTGTGSQVVPPPPSVRGPGNSVGAGRSVPAAQVVPPSPSVLGAGGPGAGTRLGSLSGSGSEIVPPAPSVESGGNAGASGRLGSLSGDSSQIAAPPPTVESAANSATSGQAQALASQPPGAASPATQASNESKGTVEELPLGFLGLIWAPPGTSYFSNFEVFVAKRKVGKDQLQLIKLVYEFLPYQRRLSDYDLNNLPPRVIKLRVTPDPSCNESLGQMMQVHPDPEQPVKDYPELPEALRSSDLNAVLPCYRTTADDFRKAMSRGR